MIKMQNYTPDIYYNRSRDFQALGRSLDIVLNYTKQCADLTGADLHYEVDDSLVDLAITTLGFKKSHSYNASQLKKLYGIFSYLLHNKGNLNALESILNMINNIAGDEKTSYITVDTSDMFNILIYTSEEVTDTTLFEDVLDYILPAGITYNIVNQTLIQTEVNTVIDAGSVSLKNSEIASEYKTSAVYKTNSTLNNQGLAVGTVVGIDTSDNPEDVAEVYYNSDKEGE